MSPQPPPPGRQPRPSGDDEPTLPYGIPSQQPPAYYQTRADHRPPQSNPYGRPPGYDVPPGYEVPQGFMPPPPQKRTNKPWLIAGAIALVVALAGGAGVVVLSRGGGAEDDAATAPVPTGSFTDGL